MRFDRRELLHVVRGAEACAAGGKRAGILGCARIDLDAAGATLWSTDREHYYRGRVAGEAAEAEGASCVVLAEPLLRFVRGVKGDEVDLALGHSKLHARCGEIEAEVLGYPTDEFPEWPQAALVPAIEPTSPDFLNDLERCSIAASVDEARPHMMGVAVLRAAYEHDGRRYDLVATDGHRMTCVAPLNPIVRTKALSERGEVVRSKRKDPKSRMVVE
ncbi:MAG: hypothetical protein ACREKH_13465, partial [Candidatus Rokuibacteriota bacterium]